MDQLSNHLPRMRLLQVVPDISRRDAGPSYSVTRLAEELGRRHDVAIHTLTPQAIQEPDIETIYYPRVPPIGSLGVSPAMRTGLARAAAQSQILHFHGLWTMSSVYAGRATANSECSLVISPRGMLEPWALRWHARRKRCFGALLQERVLRSADCFHATSGMEAESIRDAGYDAPIAVIPIGIDLPRLGHAPEVNRRTLLYLGRLHPKKNIDGLLRAWASVRPRHPDWDLMIAGSGDSRYVNSLHALANSNRNVTIRGPAYGEEKAALFRSAELFVLPTHSENFGIVVAEALSFGLPVVTTTGAPWENLGDHGCGWWVGNSDDELAATIEGAMNSDRPVLAAMGRRGRRWMAEDFSWSSVAGKTAAVYDWLRLDTEPPSFVTS